MAECKKCIHNAVCKTAESCDGYVSGCEHFKEKKQGQWIAGNCTACGYPIPTDNRYDFMDESSSLFCYHCGAKMDGGNEDGF